MVWQLPEFSLQYLQIDALHKPVTPAVSAETRRDRATDWRSGALTRARFASEHLKDASARRLRVSKGNTSHPLIALRLQQELQMVIPSGQADTVIIAESAIVLGPSA